MRCIVCDRCGKIIENPKEIRILTCARPFPKPKVPPSNGTKVKHCRGDDPQMNDIFWEKEICLACNDELESFFEKEPVAPPEPEEPDAPEPTDPNPEEPGGDEGESGDGGDEDVP